MKIQKISVSQINPAPYNPRVDLTPEDPAYQELEKSMTNLGYVDPIVWNCQTGNLVGGHQRFKILVNQGLTEIDVSVVDLPLEKEKMLNIALNKIKGQWDYPKLANILQDFGQVPDFDFESIGFTAPDLSNILDNYLPMQDDAFDFDAAVESIEEPITKKGDLVELGLHKVLCGDAADYDDLKRLVSDAKVDLIISDPPYLARYLPGNRPGKKKNKKRSSGKMIQNDAMSQQEYDAWLNQVLTNITSVISAGTPFYIWNGFRQFGSMGQMLINLNCHLSNVITWMKPSICISYSDYNFQSEFCLYGWLKGDVPHKWYGSTKESNVHQVARPTSRIHQNQKPLELIQRSIRNSSKRGDVVLDIFLGSGTSLVSAESLGRRCFGIEVDPKYVDGIVRRYIAFVGKDNVSPEIRKRYVKEDSDGK